MNSKIGRFITVFLAVFLLSAGALVIGVGLVFLTSYHPLVGIPLLAVAFCAYVAGLGL